MIDNAGVSEGMNLGVKLGLDPKILAGTSPFASPCNALLFAIPLTRPGSTRHLQHFICSLLVVGHLQPCPRRDGGRPRVERLHRRLWRTMMPFRVPLLVGADTACVVNSQVDLMAKDVSLAINAAHGVKAPIPLGAVALQVYNMISTQGGGGKDFSSVFEFFNKGSAPKQ